MSERHALAAWASAGYNRIGSVAGRSRDILCRRQQENVDLGDVVKFSELVRLLERHGFSLVKEKGSIRYYGKPGWPRLVRIDYHGSKEVPKGTCHAILKAAGVKQPR